MISPDDLSDSLPLLPKSKNYSTALVLNATAASGKASYGTCTVQVPYAKFSAMGTRHMH